MRRTYAVVASALAAGAAVVCADITKTPDLGNYWNPIGANGTSTWVYADSFVADASGVTDLGTWLDSLGTGGSGLRFEVWGDTGGNGPDPFNVIASTGSVNIGDTSGLQYFEYPASGAISTGSMYWFVITAVGETGPGFYQTGGHTQNSQYQDNGTFWYANDPNGIVFDGRGLTPEMAFHVGTIPAPAGLALLGLAGLVAKPRRR